MDKYRGKINTYRLVVVIGRITIITHLFTPVYTLWRHPQIIPLLHTPDLVLQKLRGGADLMTPGLARGPPFPSRAIKSSVVAVASLEQPSVPRFVGICEIDVASLREVQGAKGHAVKGYHWEGDEIWAWSQGGNSGANAPEAIEGWNIEAETETVIDENHHQSLDSPEAEAEAEDGGVSLPDVVETGGAEPSRNEFEGGENYLTNENPTVEKEFSTKGINVFQHPMTTC